MSNPLGANSTVSLRHLEHQAMFQSHNEVIAIIFINVDISQGLQAISLPFTDCAFNEATMNGCTICFFLFISRFER